jgi:hypothetical protein
MRSRVLTVMITAAGTFAVLFAGGAGGIARK